MLRQVGKDKCKHCYKNKQFLRYTGEHIAGKVVPGEKGRGVSFGLE
jgi:hypothetical protein